MKNDRKLRIAEEWARRNPPGPNDTRDAVLGWVGTIVVALLVCAIFSAEPSDRQQRADEAARAEQERQRVRLENCRYAGVDRCPG